MSDDLTATACPTCGAWATKIGSDRGSVYHYNGDAEIRRRVAALTDDEAHRLGCALRDAGEHPDMYFPRLRSMLLRALGVTE
jgi:hypothetical protein